MYHNSLLDPKRLGLALGIALVAAGLAQAAPSDPVKCQREIAKRAGLYDRTRVKALKVCEDKVLKGIATGPCPDTVATDKINKALTKLTDGIKNQCCGSDKTCGAGTGDAADLSLASINESGRISLCLDGTRAGLPCGSLADCPSGTACNPADGCPNIESGNFGSYDCDNLFTNPSDVGPCLSCAGSAIVDQVVSSTYGSFKPKGSVKAIELCKQAIGRETVKFVDKKRNFLRTCQDKDLHDVIPGPCPDALTAQKISDAEDKMLELIAKKCGGHDKVFGGTGADADINLNAVTTLIACPGVDVPGAGPACYKKLTTVQDYAECLACVAEYKVDCSDALATPGNLTYPSECNGNCGNGVINAGETCDDSNVLDGDACPGNCVINSACAVNGTVTATVAFSAPAGTNLSGLTVYLDYPDGEVRIPGTANQPSVENRISLISPNDNQGVFTPNDREYSLQVVTFTGDNSALASPLLTVDFDTCTGSSVTDSDFICRVLDAGSTAGAPVGDVTCTVDVP